MTITHFDTPLQVIEYISNYITTIQDQLLYQRQNQTSNQIQQGSQTIQDNIETNLNTKFNLAISGGKTPLEMFRYWFLHNTISYTKSIIYQIDERYLQKNNKNYQKYANQFAFKTAFEGGQNLKNNTQNWFVPINLDLSYEEAVADYNLKIAKLNTHSNKLNLALLGLGTDGHFASIFPNMDKQFFEDATTNSFATNYVIRTTANDLYPVSQRISLTPQAIAKAQKIMIILVGQDKKAVLNELQNGKLTIVEFPAKYWLNKENVEILCCF